MKKLEGKVALVTGGSRGIGEGIAKCLAKEGATVVISYQNSSEKAKAVVESLKKEGVKAAAFKADQAKPNEVEQLIENVIKSFGKLDILVNNAGVLAWGAIDDATPDTEGLTNQQAVNLDSVVTTTRAAVPHMPDGSRIILIGSTSGERAGGGGYAGYCATKAALKGYTQGWAWDLAKKKITVNLVQPGPIHTDMNPDTSDFAEEVKKLTPLKRYGKPEEVGAAVAFLASPEASFITGTSLNVDGGLNA